MRRLSGLVLACSMAATVCAWEWPTESASLVSTFGQSNDGAYLRGIIVQGEFEEVYPVAEGVVVLVRKNDRTRSALGSVVLVEHTNGMRSLYGNLSPGIEVSPGQAVDRSSPIGVMGDSGRTHGPALFLGMYDTTSGSWVNPMLLLPGLEDRRRPSIRRVLLQSRDSLRELSNGAPYEPGTYSLIIECSDVIDPPATVAPYSVAVFVDGVQVFAVKHDRIVLNGDATLLPGPVGGHDRYRTDTGEYIVPEIELPPGRSRIEVIARDFRGLEGSVSWEIVERQ